MSEVSENNSDASVFRSGLDSRVWVPCMEGGYAVADNEAMSSTSLQRVKAYVVSKMGAGTWHYNPECETWFYVCAFEDRP